ncbi:MAG: radical SAM protein [Theionarchaea archaeon]|nr:radical SAM protein [Theionarchaea archaeon]
MQQTSKEELVFSFLKKKQKMAKSPPEKRVYECMEQSIEEWGYTDPIIAPLKVTYEVTQACNLNCVHCSSRADKKAEDELSTQEAKRIIDELDEMKAPVLGFSGGEPFLREDLLDLMKYAIAKGMLVNVATNGLLMDEEKAYTLKKMGVYRVQVSLDGPEPIHERIRRRKGSFCRTIEGIKHMVEAGLNVVVTPTITTVNYTEVPKLLELACELGVDSFSINDLIPVGRGKEIEVLAVSQEHYNALDKFFIQERNRKRGEIDLKWAAVSPGNIKISKGPIRMSKCRAGFTMFNISWNGHMEPCNLLHMKAGDLRESSIKEVLLNSSLLCELRNRNNLEGVCGLCLFRWYCGGCRARAFGYTGSYMGADPRCPGTGGVS